MTSKAGFNRRKQRYCCRACRRWFRENPAIPAGAKHRSGINSVRGRRPKSLPSKGHLILSLQAIAERLGKTPTTTDINEQAKAGCGEKQLHQPAKLYVVITQEDGLRHWRRTYGISSSTLSRPPAAWKAATPSFSG